MVNEDHLPTALQKSVFKFRNISNQLLDVKLSLLLGTLVSVLTIMNYKTDDVAQHVHNQNKFSF